MIKIVVDARTMGSQPSGIGFYLYDFLKELIHAEELHISLITDVAESEQIQNLQQQNVSIICYGKRIYRSAGVYAYFKFVKNYLYEEQPDVFWEPNNLIPIRLYGFSGKIVLTIHDLFPITNPEYFTLIYRLYFRYGIKNSIHRADALLFDSNETRCCVHHYFPEAVHKCSFTSYLVVDDHANVESYDGGYFLYIGNIEKRKGSDILLKAYRKYCNEGGTMPLYLGGRIREKKLLLLINELAVQYPTFHHFGYLTQEEKEKLIAGCNCFLFPSKAEGFGLPPLEALKYGKRVITSNLPIFQEILCGATEFFDISGPEEQQIDRLSKCMMSCQTTPVPAKAQLYTSVLKKYDPQRLSESLINFILNLEDNCEDSI
ncbi:MAG: glycosyltransferase family 4 protein [Clostridiales bacterium]|nr:glycosyltransferase family 4 protein [Clostridiales bacterium]